MDKEKIDKLINETQREFAEILDTDLYLPMKKELQQHNITHSMGIKKEMFKNRVEGLFNKLKKDLSEVS